MKTTLLSADQISANSMPDAPTYLKKLGSLLLVYLAFALAGTAFGVETPEACSKAVQCSALEGQRLIDIGHYEAAIREFTCVVQAAPTEVEGYRGRIEAQLLLGRYSDALADYGRVTALVLPLHPDAGSSILNGYANRLAANPESIPALTGASFARWWLFDYAQAIHVLNQLLAVRPDDVYGNLFRGSSRLLRGATRAQGIADLERAIALAPNSADVRFIVSDAYTYGEPDAERALAEATLALQWGLDTARMHAIIAGAYIALGDLLSGAVHIHTHIELVTTDMAVTPPLGEGNSLSLDLVPGQTYEIPVPAIAGEMISIATSSRDFWDTIAVLVAPDGSPIIGSDDANAYFAAFDWVAEHTATYRLRVTSFEGISTGVLEVARAISK